MNEVRQDGRTALAVGTPRVRLRPWCPDTDDAHWRGWLRDPDVARWLGALPARGGPSAAYDFCIERVVDQAPLGRLLLSDPSEDGRAELVIAIGRAEDRGHHYGREAIELALAFAFDTLHVSEVYLRVGPDNDRAVRCYLASGFVKEGLLKRSPLEHVLLMSYRGRAG